MDNRPGWIDGLTVLDAGLPELPIVLEYGQEFPVARWVGPRYAAVLTVDRHEDEGDEEFDSDAQTFRRIGGAWEETDGSGGTGWFDPPFARPPMGRRDASVFGEHSMVEAAWGCCAVYGIAGVDARFVEVSDADGTTRRPIESPIGAFIVCSDAREEAIVRVIGADGTPMLEETFGGYSWLRS